MLPYLPSIREAYFISSQVLSTANEEGKRGRGKGKTLLFYRWFNS
ncbi:hypothetical protein COO91_08015 [Nostoc flagelliforme CCNUN1]|uniref:Uncharacterized protein n=1 Tax=Nostoc flagelliforme CCNUN1 TaxID=2038116 RepID=A0A2K8T2J5_9NOSO|nr:hypothetical protein COO91_08015 [Nostoc flagelliforme CCNUN1]